jgi:hypothetical protein
MFDAFENNLVTTPFWVKWEDETATPKVGDLGSSGTPECLEFDNRSQDTLHWSVLGVIGKVLNCRCLKCPLIGHLDICSPSYGQKKGRESNWQFDSRPLKVRNQPFPEVRIESATWRWKDQTPQSEVMSSQSPRTLTRTISSLQLGSPGKMCHLDVVPVEWHKEYYMGEGGGFPRVRAVVSFMSQSARGLSQHPRVSWNVN